MDEVAEKPQVPFPHFKPSQSHAQTLADQNATILMIQMMMVVVVVVGLLLLPLIIMMI